MIRRNRVVDLEANPNYWVGSFAHRTVRVRVISDSNAMQAELQVGRVDIAPLQPVFRQIQLRRWLEFYSHSPPFEGSNLKPAHLQYKGSAT
jgi:ABC-type transport system substrate-binding protein